MAKHTASHDVAAYRTGRGANQRLTILAGSKNEDGHLALIPEAGILVGDRAEGARIAGEIASRPLLEDGDTVWIQGYGAENFQLVHEPHNRDWWLVVPVGILRHGERYYHTFEGFGQWTIRDAADRGRAVPWDLRKQMGIERVSSVQEARDAVEAMNTMVANDERFSDQRVDHRDYMRITNPETAAA